MDLEALIESYLSTTKESNNKFSNDILEMYAGNESAFLKLISSEAVDNTQSFLLVSILEESSKKLTFNILELFQCCLYFVESMGDNLAKDIFIDYLVTKSEEFEVIFKHVIKDDSYNEYLDWFLLAGYQINKSDYIEKSIGLLKRNNEKTVRSVLFTLSRTEVVKEELIDRILSEIESQLENNEIDIRTGILRLIVSIPPLSENLHARILSIVESL